MKKGKKVRIIPDCTHTCQDKENCEHTCCKKREGDCVIVDVVDKEGVRNSYYLVYGETAVVRIGKYLKEDSTYQQKLTVPVTPRTSSKRLRQTPQKLLT